MPPQSRSRTRAGNRGEYSRVVAANSRDLMGCPNNLTFDILTRGSRDMHGPTGSLKGQRKQSCMITWRSGSGVVSFHVNISSRHHVHRSLPSIASSDRSKTTERTSGHPCPSALQGLAPAIPTPSPPSAATARHIMSPASSCASPSSFCVLVVKSPQAIARIWPARLGGIHR